MQIGALVAAADIVGLAGSAALDHKRQSLGVILDVKLIADLLAVAVNRQWLLSEPLDDYVWNKLFREMIGAKCTSKDGPRRRMARTLLPFENIRCWGDCVAKLCLSRLTNDVRMLENVECRPAQC